MNKVRAVEESLRDKVIVISGAGSGVGRATAIAVAAAGAVPVLVGRRAETLQGCADEIARRGGRSAAVPTDVTDEAAVSAMVHRVGEEHGGIDAVVLSAAVGLYGPVEDFPLTRWNTTLETNLTGIFLCAREVVEPMRRRGGGTIIAIASGAGKQGYAGLAAYAASKFGVIGFMESLAAEVAVDGIKVSTVVPGSIMTGFAGRDEGSKRAAAEADGSKRFLEAEDVAEAVMFLLRQPKRAWTQELNLWPF